MRCFKTTGLDSLTSLKKSLRGASISAECIDDLLGKRLLEMLFMVTTSQAACSSYFDPSVCIF